MRELTIGQGSLDDTYIDSTSLHEYSGNLSCEVSSINAIEIGFHKLPTRRYAGYLSPENMSSIQAVYKELYPIVVTSITCSYEV